MSDFFATNSGTTTGDSGVDRLTVAGNFDAGGIWFLNLTGDMATGYSCTFDGTLDKNVHFSGMGNFSFIDQGGEPERIHTGDGNDGLSGGCRSI